MSGASIKLYDKQRDADKRLSENFSAGEFFCKGSGCCSTAKIDDNLVDYDQQIRDHFGEAVTISSGYRCPTHNKKVGGASQSYHARGQASDIIVKNVPPLEVARFAESIGIKGIGLYDNFVHIDTRVVKFFWYSHKQYPRSTFGGTTSGGSSAAPKPSTTGYSLDQFIRDVQEACGATVDGIVGPETIKATVTLGTAKNSTHAVVEAVQKRLKELGYDPGNADGIYGSKTRAAVVAFQKANACVPDGIITKSKTTWKKLLGAMK